MEGRNVDSLKVDCGGGCGGCGSRRVLDCFSGGRSAVLEEEEEDASPNSSVWRLRRLFLVGKARDNFRLGGIV